MGAQLQRLIIWGVQHASALLRSGRLLLRVALAFSSISCYHCKFKLLVVLAGARMG